LKKKYRKWESVREAVSLEVFDLKAAAMAVSEEEN